MDQSGAHPATDNGILSRQRPPLRDVRHVGCGQRQFLRPLRQSVWRTRSGRHAPIRPAAVATHESIATYSEANQRRIFDACPHAAEVRTFHGWLAAGRIVMKGQKGIRLVAPESIDDSGKVTSIKPLYVFAVTQTQECTPRASAA